MPNLIRELGRTGVDVALAQGAFDIVHIGHAGYLQAARRIYPGNSVVAVGVDSDACVRANKGPTRPVNSVSDRVRMMAEFASAGLVFAYEDAPRYGEPEDYHMRFRALRSTTLAVAAWDPNRELKQRQTDRVGMKISFVDCARINSTTR